MKKRGIIMEKVVGMTLAVSMAASLCTGVGFPEKKHVSAGNDSEAVELKLQYDEPAADWESQALPLGNGSMGAMVFGGVSSEKIQMNESSIWSGGPGANGNYDGGSNDQSAEAVHNALQSVRQDLQNMVNDFADNSAAYKDSNGNIISNNYRDLLGDSSFTSNLDKLKGEKSNFGSYQTFGNLNITDPSNNNSYSDYIRESDINRAVQTVSYVQNGVTYTREYFMNNPSGVFVAKYSASEGGSISRNISIDSEQSKKTITSDADNGTITVTGRPSDQSENGLQFASFLKVIPENGTLTRINNSTLSVSNADSFIIIMSIGTNYKSDPTTEYNYFKDGDPLWDVEDRVNAAVEKGYDSLYEEHVNDYRNLFDRCVINIGATDVPDKMTDDLLADYSKNNSVEEDRYLETLFFQYGRYLLISSSRENSLLPANLQGIWAQGLSPAWSSDFHTNINLQMNYWLAEQTNLSECHKVVIDYISDMVEKGKVTAQKYYCRQDGSDVRGWVIHHENNIYGNTSPSNFTTAFYFPAAAAWQCQDIWEAYMFNDDEELLAKYYDTMLQAALFWVDNLWEDERDGTLVSNPSYSPEHGAYSIGCTSDQAIIWEIFDQVIKAADVLGKSGDSEIEEIKEAKSRLYMPTLDTLGGQYREWKDETTLEINNSDNHRHQNHLFVLHPGTYVVAGRSAKDDEIIEAARVTLDKRGDGGTGWSKAWKINMWARMRDGDRAHKLYKEQLSGSTLKNLFDTHPPFQIDGNFGATAGVAEMLLQSQGNYIEPLCALPGAWTDGSYSGLKARGNFEVSAKWTNGFADEFSIISKSGNECKLRYEGVKDYYVVNMTNKTYTKTNVIDDNTISFNTKKNNEYLVAYTLPEGITFTEEKDEPAATPVPDNKGNEIVDNNTDKKDPPAQTVTLKKPVLKKIKAVKNGMKVTIKKKVKNASGYEVKYSAKKNMKKAKVVKLKGAKKLSKTIKKLKIGKKYYVQVRAFNNTGNIIYSKWSTKKSVKL